MTISGKVLILILIVLVTKAIYNLYYFFWAKYYFNRYLKYLDDHKDWYITRNKQKIVNLLKKANIQDSLLPATEPIGYGYIQTGNFSVFSNLALIRKDVARIVGQFLKEASGVFFNRFIETFNPIYWLEFFIFLPKNIANYLGFNGEGIGGRILQFLWWLLNLISLVVGIFFNHEFYVWLSRF